jgi:hypothetical protein
MATANSPITQVSQHPTYTGLHQPQLLTRLLLDLRGKRFSVDRETIMNLPESVLLCLFPNGLVLSRQSVALSENGEEGEEDEQLYGVDVSTVPTAFTLVPLFPVRLTDEMRTNASSTRNASHTSSTSSATPRTRSTGRTPSRACSPPSSTSSTARPRPSWAHQTPKTHSSQNRLSLSSARSSNISLSRPKPRVLPRTHRASPTTVC